MFDTYEQTKKGLSYFYPKRQVQDDEIHTTLLNLKITDRVIAFKSVLIH